MNPSKSTILRFGKSKKLQPTEFAGIPTATSGTYLGACLSKKSLQQVEFSRCRRSLYGRYNAIIRHCKHKKYLTHKCKSMILNTFGCPYGIETLDELPSSIRKAHRTITMSLWPSSFHIKDANNVTIRSRTLYQTVARCPSLPERHRKLRNNFILQASTSTNVLIQKIVGSIQLITSDADAVWEPWLMAFRNYEC